MQVLKMIKGILNVMSVLRTLLIGLSVLGAQTATALDTYLFGVPFDKKSEYSRALEFWVDEIFKQTRGDIYLNPIYSIDSKFNIEVISVSQKSKRYPELAYIVGGLGIPGEVKNWVNATNEIRPILDKYLASEGLKYLWLQPSLTETIVCKDRFLITPADWVSASVIVPDYRTQDYTYRMFYRTFVEVLDINPVYGSNKIWTWPDSYELECFFGNYLQLQDFLDTRPYIVDMGAPQNVLIYSIKKDIWDKFSEAERNTIISISIEAEKYAAKNIDSFEILLREPILEAGGKIYELSAAEKETFWYTLRPGFNNFDYTWGHYYKSDSQRIRKVLNSSYETKFDTKAALLNFVFQTGTLSQVSPTGRSSQPSSNKQKPMERVPIEETSHAGEEDLGLRRDERRLIQQGLASTGLHVGIPDGIFGKRTRAGIRQWQSFEGYLSSGYLNRRQVNILMELGSSPGTSDNTSDNKLGPTHTVSKEEISKTDEAALNLGLNDRILIQQGLARSGFDVGTPDGIFGKRTRTGIRRFQIFEGFTETGYLYKLQVEMLKTRAKEKSRNIINEENKRGSRISTPPQQPVTNPEKEMLKTFIDILWQER